MTNYFRLCLSLMLLCLRSYEVSSLQHRIIGGSTSLGSSTDRFSMASVRLSNVQGQFHICGGFIINKRWVGTAAQCLVDQTTQNTVVAVGTTTIAGGIIYTVNQIEKHQNYNELTLMNDVALLRTEREIVFAANIAPAILKRNAVLGSRAVNIFGWGRTSANSNLSANLLRHSPSTISNDACLTHFPFVARRFITDRHICTSRSNSASCPGDAGGPVYLENEVIGIVSWVEPCVAGQINVNIRISVYINWILSFTRVDD